MIKSLQNININKKFKIKNTSAKQTKSFNVTKSNRLEFKKIW